MKRCSKCGEVKDINEFSKKLSKNRINDKCDSCYTKSFKHNKVRLKLSSGVSYAILNKNNTNYYINALGCHKSTLKKHLENKFTKGMSFNNYGKWHVDHIIPCASFDLTNTEHQKECFNYRNLQPLWVKDNLSKGSKMPHAHQRSLPI